MTIHSRIRPLIFSFSQKSSKQIKVHLSQAPLYNKKFIKHHLLHLKLLKPNLLIILYQRQQFLPQELESVLPTTPSLKILHTQNESNFEKHPNKMEIPVKSNMMMDLNQGFGSPVENKVSQPNIRPSSKVPKFPKIYK